MTGRRPDEPPTDVIPAGVREAIPARFVERHRVVPVSLEAGVLRVAHPEDVDRGALRELEILLNLTVQGEVRDRDSLDRLIRQNYGLGAPAIESLVRAENGGTTTDAKRPKAFTSSRSKPTIPSCRACAGRIRDDWAPRSR